MEPWRTEQQKLGKRLAGVCVPHLAGDFDGDEVQQFDTRVKNVTEIVDAFLRGTRRMDGRDQVFPDPFLVQCIEQSLAESESSDSSKSEVLRKGFSWLFKCARNLLLDPRRPKMRKISLSQGAYVYYVGKLHDSQRLLEYLGYKEQGLVDGGAPPKALVLQDNVDIETVFFWAIGYLAASRLLTLLEEACVAGAGAGKPYSVQEALVAWRIGPCSPDTVKQRMRAERQRKENEELERQRQEDARREEERLRAQQRQKEDARREEDRLRAQQQQEEDARTAERLRAQMQREDMERRRLEEIREKTRILEFRDFTDSEKQKQLDAELEMDRQVQQGLSPEGQRRQEQRDALQGAQRDPCHIPDNSQPYFQRQLSDPVARESSDLASSGGSDFTSITDTHQSNALQTSLFVKPKVKAMQQTAHTRPAHTDLNVASAARGGQGIQHSMSTSSPTDALSRANRDQSAAGGNALSTAGPGRNALGAVGMGRGNLGVSSPPLRPGHIDQRSTSSLSDSSLYVSGRTDSDPGPTPNLGFGSDLLPPGAPPVSKWLKPGLSQLTQGTGAQPQNILGAHGAGGKSFQRAHTSLGANNPGLVTNSAQPGQLPEQATSGAIPQGSGASLSAGSNGQPPQPAFQGTGSPPTQHALPTSSAQRAPPAEDRAYSLSSSGEAHNPEHSPGIGQHLQSSRAGTGAAAAESRPSATPAAFGRGAGKQQAVAGVELEHMQAGGVDWKAKFNDIWASDNDDGDDDNGHLEPVVSASPHPVTDSISRSNDAQTGARPSSTHRALPGAEGERGPNRTDGTDSLHPSARANTAASSSSEVPRTEALQVAGDDQASSQPVHAHGKASEFTHAGDRLGTSVTSHGTALPTGSSQNGLPVTASPSVKAQFAATSIRNQQAGRALNHPGHSMDVTMRGNPAATQSQRSELAMSRPVAMSDGSSETRLVPNQSLYKSCDSREEDTSDDVQYEPVHKLKLMGGQPHGYGTSKPTAAQTSMTDSSQPAAQEQHSQQTLGQDQLSVAADTVAVNSTTKTATAAAAMVPALADVSRSEATLTGTSTISTDGPSKTCPICGYGFHALEIADGCPCPVCPSELPNSEAAVLV